MPSQPHPPRRPPEWPGERPGSERARPRRTTGADADGVRVSEAPGVRKSVWLVAAAIALVAASLLAIGRLVLESLPGAPAPVVAQAEPPRPAAPAPPRRPGAPALRGAARATPPPSPAPEAPAPAPAPAPAEPDFTVAPPGSPPSGIALFPPPGTDPPKVGVVVPDDYELPEGYVRHYQATDDGQELAPILLFHPDYEWVDEGGNPVEMPADRVVPPEMAPPGLAIEMLEIPAPRDEPDPAP